jgi:hypothetical protein
MTGARGFAIAPFATLLLAAAAPRAADTTPNGVEAPVARAFPHDAGVVDLLVTGPAAKLLYDRLPGDGQAQACGASGLHKGDGSMSCVADGSRHSCHIWIDAPRQRLALPEENDC